MIRFVGPITTSFLLALFGSNAVGESNTDCSSEIAADGCIQQNVATWSGKFRGRYEMADDSINDNAHAVTGRVSLEYKSKHYNHWQGLLELEHVFTLDSSAYFDAGSSYAGLGTAVVADPTGTEVNQAYIQHTGLPNFDIRLGRQKYSHRAYPWQRYLGTVSWRQNEQTVDGATLSYTNQNQLNINVAYLYNVNRIFGRNNPLPNRKAYNVDALVLNGNYAFTPRLKVDAYVFDLDFPNAEFLSATTMGARVDWSQAPERIVYLHAFELAVQYPDGTDAIGSDESTYYMMFQTGLTLPERNDFTFKVGAEILSGDGTVSFKTPLATLHAYQGWTDKFLSTPPEGITDFYFTLGAKFNQTNALFVYHLFKSEEEGYDYGSEIGASVSFPFSSWQTGAKVAIYTAADTSRFGGWTTDSTKFWTWIQRSF